MYLNSKIAKTSNKCWLLLIAVLGLYSFVGCNERSDVKTYRIGFSQCCDDAWRTTMNREMEREAAFHPELELLIEVAGSNSQKQLDDIDLLIKSGIDLLIVSPNEAEPLQSKLDSIYKSGTPIIMVDRKTDSKLYSAFVGGDNYEIGRSAAKYLKDLHPDGIRALELETPIFNGKPANCIYWIGSFKNGAFTPNDLIPKSFEHFSEELLAPSLQKDSDDQWIYIGIIPEDRSQTDQIAAGWRQTFSVPRVIRLLDDKKTIAHTPPPNLCRMRKNEVRVQNRKISPNTNFNIPEYKGTQSEIECKFYAKDVNQIYLQVYKNDAGTEMTTLILDKALKKITINRFLSSPYNTAKDIRSQNYTFRPDDTINVSIFLDHSILEVFVDDLVVISSRVYPSIASNNIDIITTNNEIELVSFKAWDMGDKETSYPEFICPKSLLPDNLYSGTHDFNSTNLTPIIYPNPSSQGEYFVKMPMGFDYSTSELFLFDINGNPIREFKITLQNDSIKLILPQDIKGSFFLGKLQVGNKISTLKFIK